MSMSGNVQNRAPVDLPWDLPTAAEALQDLDPEVFAKDLKSAVAHSGLERTEDGRLTIKMGDISEIQKVGDASAAAQGQIGGMPTALPAPVGPMAQLGPQQIVAAESLFVSLTQAFDKTFATKGLSGSSAGRGQLQGGEDEEVDDTLRLHPSLIPGNSSIGGKDLGAVPADRLLTEFMKLNLLSPEKSLGVMNELYDTLNDVAVANLEKSADMIEHTAEERVKKEKKFGILNTVINVVALVASVALTIVTFGAGAPVLALLAAGMIAGGIIGGATGGDMNSILSGMSLGAGVASLGMGIGMQAAKEAAKQAVSQTLRTLMQVVEKGVQVARGVVAYKQADEMAKVEEKSIAAEIREKMGEQQREDAELQAGFIRMIMEQKTKTFEAGMKMLRDMGVTGNQIASNVKA